jgi:hypothetical protein
MSETDTKLPKPAKSVVLTKAERKKLEGYRKQFYTDVDCAVSIGIDRLVLNRVMLVGSGAPKSIEKIREKLSNIE